MVIGVTESGSSPSYGPLLNRWLETQSEFSSIIAKKDVNSGTINNESFNEISKYCKERTVKQCGIAVFDIRCITSIKCILFYN